MRHAVIIILMLLPFHALATNVIDLERLTALNEPVTVPASLIDLGQDVRRGVEAHVQLDPLASDRLEVLSAETSQQFQIMVTFIEKRSGKVLLEGQAAARTFALDNRSMETVRLEPKQANWMGVLLIPPDGETMIKIGSQLADGKKRIYRFFYNRPVDAPETFEAEPAG